MKSNRTPLYIIGGIIVIAVIAVIAYSVNQSGPTTSTNMTTDHDMNHESDQSGQVSKSTDDVTTDQVTIANYAFSPTNITVKVGTKVTWTNQDSVEHTVTTESAAPAKIDSGLFGKGKSYSFTFTKPGTYDYFCEPHPYMKGTVVVTE